MAALDFPDTPTVGQLYGSSGTLWRWDGARWASTAGASGARGRVGYAQVTTTQPLGSTLTPFTGVSVSWTADPSRTYRTTLIASIYSSVASDYLKMNIVTGAGTDVQDTGFVPGTINGVGVSCEVVETGLSGVQTRYGAGRRATGTGSVVLYASPTNPTFILVEDITYEAGSGGPGGGASLLAARVGRSGASLSLPVGWSTFVWQADTGWYDTGGMWNAATPDRLTIPTKGNYLVHAAVRFSPNATGVRGLVVTKNSTTTPVAANSMLSDSQPGITGIGQYLQAHGPLRLNAGDYLTVGVYQNSGAALTASDDLSPSTFFAIEQIGDS